MKGYVVLRRTGLDGWRTVSAVLASNELHARTRTCADGHPDQLVAFSPDDLKTPGGRAFPHPVGDMPLSAPIPDGWDGKSL